MGWGGRAIECHRLCVCESVCVWGGWEGWGGCRFGGLNPPTHEEVFSFTGIDFGMSLHQVVVNRNVMLNKNQHIIKSFTKKHNKKTKKN